MIARGDIVWADFGAPRGSAPAKRRPALVVQGDWLTATRIATVLVVPLTSNVSLRSVPGNVLLSAAETGLDRDSVALVFQVAPLGREFLDPEPVAALPRHLLTSVEAGIRLVLGL